MPRCVVVVWEELGQQKVHVGPTGTLTVWDSAVNASRLRIVCIHLCEVLNVDWIVVCLWAAIELDAPTLLTNEVVNSVWMSLWTMAVGMASSSFQTIISHAKHFASKSVSHDRLAWLTCNLRDNTRATDVLTIIANGVRRFRLLSHGLWKCTRSDCIFQIHGPIVNIRCIGLLSISQRLVIKTCRTLESSRIFC